MTAWTRLTTLTLAVGLATLTGCAPGTGRGGTVDATDATPTAGVGAGAEPSGPTHASAGTGASPTPTEHTGTAADATADDVRATGVPLGPGGSALRALGDVAAEVQADGSVRLVVPAGGVTGDRTERVAARLVAPEGATFAVLMDGSVVVRDAAGTAVGGLTHPETAVVADAATGGDPPRARYTLASADLLDVLVTGTAGTSGTADDGATVTARWGTAAIASATWGEREGGRSLAVEPADWLRTGALAAQEVAWTQLVALVPEVDTATMRDQFDCHALGARDKATWNLEPWRPDVGGLAVLAAQCNPV